MLENAVGGERAAQGGIEAHRIGFKDAFEDSAVAWAARACQLCQCVGSREHTAGRGTEQERGQRAARRGTRLKGDDETLFNGDIFTGRGALANGLIDGIGELRGTLRARFGDKVELRIVDPEKKRFSFVLPRLFASRGEAGTSPGEIFGDLVASVEERLFWCRFGL